MQPFNPFLRSFFGSKLPAQCSPSWQFVLLVPTAEFLLSHIDAESDTPYDELVQNEDFLSSHDLRIPHSSPSNTGKDWPNLREAKSKPQQCQTLNSRAVVIKDSFVYTNRGFKNLTQAQLLHDEIYHPDLADLSQWLIYYISRPLLGSFEKPKPAPNLVSVEELIKSSLDSTIGSQAVKKKDVTSFKHLMVEFPMITKQIQPGFERHYQQFSKDIEGPPPSRPSSSSGTTLVGEEPVVDANDEINGQPGSAQLSKTISRASTTLGAMDRHLRESLETLVFSAIDSFQSVDKQQLSLLGEATDLSGPVVERMIERHVTEHVHEKLLFPKICVSTHPEDHELESFIKQMTDVDIAQIGVADLDSFGGKRELSRRVRASVAIFKSMDSANSPQEMLDILLQTQQTLAVRSESSQTSLQEQETHNVMTQQVASMNADTLVSLLLLVVIRSPIRALYARLMYMRDFVFLTEVENGQTGYALSTLEAVLAYLSSNSKALRKISNTNRRLWRAVRKGDLEVVGNLLVSPAIKDGEARSGASYIAENDFGEEKIGAVNGYDGDDMAGGSTPLTSSNLTHVFPFETYEDGSGTTQRPKMKKRVSLDTQSMSSSSLHSFASGTSTLGSVQSLIDGETTVEQLAQTQDAAGNSILFMAIESLQIKVLRHLLRQEQIISAHQVFRDRNNDDQTLLSASVQQASVSLTELVLDFIVEHADSDQHLRDYLASQDTNGRSAAHYCFSAPNLISSIGHLLPWQQKDRNRQTPLFAMCRSYDHENYRELAMNAITAAAKHQHGSGPLQLADHIDIKGNTLLHIVNDTAVIQHLLFHCDADPNAQNERRFSPLMVASKFARLDSMRVFFSDPRIDLQARDVRGLTAVEVAKDEEVRNRIDDMVLLLANPADGGRKTTIVRSIVNDDAIRMIIKSGAPSDKGTVTVTTSRRSLEDFERLVAWLSLEHPASWIPSVSNFRSPFQISPRPSKQILRDMQIRLDGFLQAMLSHSTFGTHEMLWEFFLVPDMDPNVLAERARHKAEIRIDNLVLDYVPLTSPSEVVEVEVFTGHAMAQLRQVHSSLRTVSRRVSSVRNAFTNLAESHRLAMKTLCATIPFIPQAHTSAAQAFAATLAQSEYSPPTQLQYALLTSVSTTTALLHALTRPSSLIARIASLRPATVRDSSASPNPRRSQPNRILAGLGSLLESTRLEDQEAKASKARREMDSLGRELRYTQETNAGELAAWQNEHARGLRGEIREFARGMVVRERERLKAMERARRPIMLARSQEEWDMEGRAW